MTNAGFLVAFPAPINVTLPLQGSVSVVSAYAYMTNYVIRRQHVEMASLSLTIEGLLAK